MAGIEFGGGPEGRRSTNHEVPLIPFIDFLLCLVAFLLVTAVWSRMASIDADARSPDTATKENRGKQLHVDMTSDRKFQLSWREGMTVLSTIDVPRKKVGVNQVGDFAYPDLAEKVRAEWQANGAHRAPTDPSFDRAVLHSNNSTPFEEVIAVLDALNTPVREFGFGGQPTKVPAFNVSFAVN